LNAKKNSSRTWLWALLALLLIVPSTVLLIKRMEGQPPTMLLDLKSAALGAGQELTLTVEDDQTGIREVWVALYKDGKETVLLEKVFPSANIISGGAVRTKTITVAVDPKTRGIKDGKAVLRLVTRDYSWRKWGDGNQRYEEHAVMIDTQAPGIDVLDAALNLAQGGAGVVIYTLSEECPTSGVRVGDRFYPGRGGHFKDPMTHMAFIALAHDQGKNTPSRCRQPISPATRGPLVRHTTSTPNGSGGTPSRSATISSMPRCRSSDPRWQPGATPPRWMFF
jgi:hypothetical protein